MTWITPAWRPARCQIGLLLLKFVIGFVVRFIRTRVPTGLVQSHGTHCTHASWINNNKINEIPQNRWRGHHKPQTALPEANLRVLFALVIYFCAPRVTPGVILRLCPTYRPRNYTPSRPRRSTFVPRQTRSRTSSNTLSYPTKQPSLHLASSAMEVAAGDGTTRFVLERRLKNDICLHCKRPGHTHMTCSKRPCYLCKKLGHLQQECPYRALPGTHETALNAAMAGRARIARPFYFVREREQGRFLPKAAVEVRSGVFGAKAVAIARKAHEKRVTAMAWHDSGRFVISADKKGSIVVWDLGVEDWNRDAGAGTSMKTYSSNVHYCNVNAIALDPNHGGEIMYTSSCDGTVGMSRLSLPSRGAAGASELDSSQVGAYGAEELLNLNPDGWQGPKTFRMVYGLDYDAAGRRCVYAGTCKGVMIRLDPREQAPSNVDVNVKFHKDKVQHIHVNPCRSDLIATASNDRTVALWDARKFAPGHALGTYTHGRTVVSACFSPNTGARLLTTCYDNRLRVWPDVHAYVGDVNARADEGCAPTEIVHSADFSRYLSPFKAVWDPKDWRDDLFMCGRYLGDAYYMEGDDRGATQLLHPIDLFSAKSGTLLNSLVDMAVPTTCPVNNFSPRADVIVSGSSAHLILWSAKKAAAAKEDGDGGTLLRRDSRAGVGDDEDDEDDGDGNGGPRKRRKKAAVSVRRKKTRGTPRKQ